MHSFITSTRKFFLKHAPHKHDPLSGTSSQPISTPDRVLEQLSLSLAHLQSPTLVPKNGHGHPPDPRPMSLASDPSEDDCEARTVSKCVLPRNISMLRLPVQIPTTSLNSDHLRHSNLLHRLTQVQALQLTARVVSGTRVEQHARKNAALHKMNRWQKDLHVAKGKVYECEKVLLDLQKEVEEAERNIGIIESGLVELEQKILQAQNSETYETSSSDSAHSSCGSVDFSRHRHLSAHVDS